jgi:hypothetical protein
MICSTQSVMGQPVAAPLSMPMHQGGVPSATIVSMRALSSSQVAGGVYPFASKTAFG